MANIKVNYAEFKTILSKTPYSQNILILGAHGIGKSQILEQHYVSKGFEVVPLFLGQMSDPGDLLGLPDKKSIIRAGVETMIMDFLPPYWWASDKPFCLFLDEINRGRPEVLQVVFDVALNRKLASRKLPEGSVVCAAANFGEEYQLTDMDPAFVSRFNVYELSPTTEEWLTHAAKSGVKHEITSFIAANPMYLDPNIEENADSMNKTPDRRAWFRVDEMLQQIQGKPDSVDMKMIAGVIGGSAAGLFKKHIDALVTVDARRLLYAKDFKDLEVDLMTMTMTDFMYLNKQVLNFVIAKTPEIKKKLILEKTVCNNFYQYIKFMETQEYKEAIGDLVHGLEKQAEAAAVLLADEKVMDAVTGYIDDLDLK